ncbi:hypothetical protein JCM24511_03422 [Saitozyma sp. JCM 24511]|nr:hypothetical protein JCM24511_03422 [Saitozyma sp. JCM 24511]
MRDDKEKITVLMVCLGRSPMAEAVLRHELSRRPDLKNRFEVVVDSAGTGAYHEGDDADDRTVATCRKHKIPISCTARAVARADYDRFDYILAMDNSNLQTLLHRRPPTSSAHISLFGSFDPTLLPLPHSGSPNSSHSSRSSGSSSDSKLHGKPRAISDPYYGGPSGFDKCYEQCVVYSRGFIEWLESGQGKDRAPKAGGRMSEEVRDAMGL